MLDQLADRPILRTWSGRVEFIVRQAQQQYFDFAAQRLRLRQQDLCFAESSTLRREQLVQVLQMIQLMKRERAQQEVDVALYAAPLGGIAAVRVSQLRQFANDFVARLTQLLNRVGRRSRRRGHTCQGSP